MPGLSALFAPPRFEPVAGVVKVTVPSAGFASESTTSPVGSLLVTVVAFCVVNVAPSGAMNFTVYCVLGSRSVNQ